MSEQLVQHLDAEFRRTSPVLSSTTSAFPSELPNSPVPAPACSESPGCSAPVSPADDADLDYALALQLQEEEHAQFDESKRFHPQGLVTVVSRFSMPSLALAVPQDVPQDEDEDAGGAAKAPRRPPWKVRDKSLKGQGGEGEIVTKHDLELAGQRNARRLESSVDGCGTLNSPLTNATANSLQHKLRRQEKSSASKAEEESVQTSGNKGLDQSSRLILRKLIDSRVLDEVVSVVRTGKEAVVYRALGPQHVPHGAVGFAPGSPTQELRSNVGAGGGAAGDDVVVVDEGQDGEQQRELCVKVYRTTLALFRNRADYVVGDHRFESLGDLHKLNQRKAVSVWAEKELKNLTRMFRAGLPCPEPIRLHKNVLVMSFIEKDGWGAPRLSDIAMHAMSKRKAELLLMQVLLIARAMFLRCNLVHADLSQFNILVLDGRCHVLDVGQAVDVSHPRAMDFLLADMHNVLVFFRTHSIGTGLVADQVAEWVSQGVVAGPREGEAAGAGREDEEGPWAEFAASSLGDWADVRLAARIGQVLDVC